jgi:hypothetical protein
MWHHGRSGCSLHTTLNERQVLEASDPLLNGGIVSNPVEKFWNAAVSCNSR